MVASTINGDRMSKKLRCFFEGGIYHVVQRGNNQACIFDDQLDKVMFMETIRETLELYPCKFLYYCLMDNHYHLVFEMMQTDLSKIMHRINLSYSKYFNQKYNRSGTIFGRRYGAFPVKDVSHFYALILYIAYNPVKASLVWHPKQYHWCAHLDIVSKRKSIVDKKCLLSRFHSSYAEARNKYIKLIEGEQNQPVIYENLEDVVRETRRQTLEFFFQEMVGNEVLAHKILTGERCADAFNLKNDFIRKSRVQGYSVQEIASFLGITARAVRYHL